MTRKWVVAGILFLLVAAAVPLLAWQNTSTLLRPPLVASPGAAQRFAPAAPVAGYMMLEGTRQGKFKGSAGIKGLEDSIAIQRFDYEIVSPRDTATGMATGKRQHKPIRIIKEWDASTPMLFQALTTNEVLKTAKFSFYRPTPTGQSELFQVVTLTNASVTGIKQFTGDPSVNIIPRIPADTARFEEVSFVFQKIEIENKPAGTTAVDDFSAAR
jgi:type VI secretion system secreted protein Hcp